MIEYAGEIDKELDGVSSAPQGRRRAGVALFDPHRALASALVQAPNQDGANLRADRTHTLAGFMHPGVHRARGDSLLAKVGLLQS